MLNGDLDGAITISDDNVWNEGNHSFKYYMNNTTSEGWEQTIINSMQQGNTENNTICNFVDFTFRNSFYVVLAYNFKFPLKNNSKSNISNILVASQYCNFINYNGPAGYWRIYYNTNNFRPVMKM